MKNFALTAIAALCLVLAALVSFARAPVSAYAAQEEPTPEQDASTLPNVFLRDVVVSNTDRDLKNTDMFFNSEPGIAINPSNPREIVISSFSGAWSPQKNGQFKNAPLWYTTNGGRLWTKEFTITPPPGAPRSAVVLSPCDETFAYGRDGVLYGTFLLPGNGEEGADCSSAGSDSPAANANPTLTSDVYTGATADPANAQSWRWFVQDGKTQPTNQHFADQPWVLVNKDPDHPKRQNVYVAYQSNPAMQVAVAKAAAPPDFVLDRQSGFETAFGGNPGHRIAADPRSGALYSLYQSAGNFDCGSAAPVRYMLNRSLDGGHTWELNGNPDGIEAAHACSHQNLVTYLFGEPVPGTILGGVNSLRGGADALAVDSKSGDVYVVYGRFDDQAGRDRIGIVRLADCGNGTMEPGPPTFVSGPQHQSALPAIAVAEDKDGTVGVLYDTADGLDEETSRPYFSIHLAVSRDRGATFQRVRLQKFLFPQNAPTGNGPRPLGDYQQLKSVGKVFYGVFSGDGQPFGRPFHKIDPIFVRASIP